MPRFKLSASARSLASRGLTIVAAPYARIEVRTMSGNLIPIYLNDTMPDLAPNPLTADSEGNWSAWI